MTAPDFDNDQDPGNPRPRPFLPGEPPPQEADKDAPRTWQILRPSDLRAWNPPTGNGILGGNLLNKGDLCIVSGISGLGKSTFCLGLAAAVIRGDESFCGFRIAPESKATNWLFVGNENGRLRWKRDAADVERDLTPDQLEAWERQMAIPDIADAENPEMSLPGSGYALTTAIRETAAGVVVADPWNALTSDEIDSRNHTETMRHLFAACRAGNPHVALIVVAHAGSGHERVARAGGRFDGGSSLRGNNALHLRARSRFNLAPFDDKADGDFVLQVAKHSNADPREIDLGPRRIRLDRAGLRFTMVEGFNVEAWQGSVAARAKPAARKVTPEDVWQAVRDEARTRGEVFDRVRNNPSKPSSRSVDNAIKDAVELGFVDRLPGKKLGLGPRTPKP